MSREKRSPVVSLSSCLDAGPAPDLYFSCNPDKIVEGLLAPAPRDPGTSREEDPVMKHCVLTPDFEKRENAPPITISKHIQKKLAKVFILQLVSTPYPLLLCAQATRDASTGSKWFHMSAPQLTPQLKNDLRLLKMRNALDPSRHYKANDSKEIPRYFQVGRVVADSADFYSSRIPKRQQGQTLVDELLSNDQFQTYHRKKYLELQDKFMSGTARRKKVLFKKKFKKA